MIRVNIIIENTNAKVFVVRFFPPSFSFLFNEYKASLLGSVYNFHKYNKRAEISDEHAAACNWFKKGTVWTMTKMIHCPRGL